MNEIPEYKHDCETKVTVDKTGKVASGIYVGQPSVMCRLLAAQNLFPIETANAENDKQMN